MPKIGLSTDQTICKDDLEWNYYGDIKYIAFMDSATLRGFNLVTRAHLMVEKSGKYTPGVYINVKNYNCLFLLYVNNGKMSIAFKGKADSVNTIYWRSGI